VAFIQAFVFYILSVAFYKVAVTGQCTRRSTLIKHYLVWHKNFNYLSRGSDTMDLETATFLGKLWSWLGYGPGAIGQVLVLGLLPWGRSVDVS
jgi:hypothetical protein